MILTLTPTLSRYLAKSYFLNFLFLLLVLLGIIYLFDTVELIRRASKHSDIPLTLVLQMGLLKLPEVGQILLPFAVLFSGMYTFWQLTRRYELIVARAAGFSVWQFLAPVMSVAITIGALQIAVINPVGALLIGKFEQLENRYLSRQENQIAVFNGGLWLRQSVPAPDQYMILYAPKIEQPGWDMRDVTVLFFDDQDALTRRYDAQKASLDDQRWVFENVLTHPQQTQPAEVANITLPTQLTVDDIEESFSSPQTIAFWRLRAHIEILEETGFDASRLKVHYHNLLAQPLMLAAMILLAAAVSLRPPRFRGTVILIGIGIFMGFVVFFSSSFLQALGASGQIPVFFAAWTPAIVSFLLGVSVMINLEDG